MNESYCEVTGKKCYSKRDAGDTIRFFKNNRVRWNNRGKNIPMRSYYCKYCSNYHLTHHKSVPKDMRNAD